MSARNQIVTIRPTDLFLWNLCAEYTKEYPDPRQPVRSELVDAFIPRVIRLLTLHLFAAELLDHAGSQVETSLEARELEAREAVKALVGDVQSSRGLISQVVELDGWLHKPGIDEMGCGNWLADRGYSFEDASKLIKGAKKYESGRRPSKRQITVAALEARKFNGNRSWSNLANAFCDCEKFRHDDLCSEALRKSAAQLESVLQKYREIPIPLDLIAPLSNVFVKSLKRLRKRHSS
jgi:hypothetical protein